MARISTDEAKSQAQVIIDEAVGEAVADTVYGLTRGQHRNLEDRLGREVKDEDEDMILDLIQSADIFVEVTFA